MAIKIIAFVNLVAYSFIVSQSFFYMLALRNVQENMQPAAYIELRKLLDKNMRSKFSIVIYGCLLSCGALTIISGLYNASSLLFINSVIALLALIIEIILALKGNIPINQLINTWSPENYPANWKAHRNRWLAVFAKRQLATTIGFLSLLAGVVFGI